jgi:dTDP-4-amino-4,6-dideoxygalactose transaminase
VKVPFVDLKRSTALVRDAVPAAWQQSIDDADFVLGPRVAELELMLGRRLGAPHVVACASGSDALRIALATVGVGPGSTVALPDLTFWATYEAVVQLGAIPLLLDVDRDDLQLDLEELRRAADAERLDAVILVHLMGWASPRLESIRAFCRERGIALVEDGAQAYGVELAGRSVFQGAELATLSFYPAKVLGGCMDGGAVVMRDESSAALARQLCNHGRSSHFGHERVGWKSRMSTLQATWLLAMLVHAESIVRDRRASEARYRAMAPELGGLVRAYGPPEEVSGNGYLSVWGLEREDHERVAAELKRAGIGVGRVYPATLSEQQPARAARRISALETSRAFCRRVINLPLFYGLHEAEIDHVAAAFRRALGVR